MKEEGRVLFLLALCILGLAAVSARNIHSSPPVWPPSYQVYGYLRLPYAELKEPYAAFYDGKNNRSRIDFYGGMVKTYQINQYEKYGATFKIAYMTNQTIYNYQRCFQSNGSADNVISGQSMLPDLTGFTLADSQMILEGRNVSMWSKLVTHGTKRSKYTMYVMNDNSQQPYRYEMYGYDSLLGSHFDKYYVDYFNYSAGPIPDEMFEVPLKDTCAGFPGPGNSENSIQFNPMREFINHDDSHHQEMFAKYKKTHSKQYSSDKEHAQREANFRHNVRYIHSKNRSPITYTLAVNHLADRTHEEIKLLNGRRHTKGYNGAQAFNKKAYNAPLPDSLDWRLFGAVNPVKDQAVCGSCWSFGTTGTIEGSYFLATGNLVRLSQQELMDCSWGYGNNACDGGEEFRAYQWIMDNGGLATEDNYGPYKGVDFMCQSKKVKPTVKLSGYVNVTAGDLEALKIAMFNHGPIAVDIDASHLSLSFYANGVYYEEACRNDPDGLDHAVLAVGYGVMHGQEYWLVKNSWSTYWGNAGYVLMSQKNNNCGVATSPTFAKIANTNH